ncbi:DUF2141 domain-containing protein [uncultured Algimonas sp.]|uniref:DUF2141 domain-containing protein n=1 Tax=uncultured Algimonas sp. TaxID=1547920 RepID=UPI002630C229|nr:DUF2141 domain-containing protein [uncultured Algimonas sp.]
MSGGRIRRKCRRSALLVAAGVMSGAIASQAAAASDPEPLSAIGAERGLELYERDAADQCVLGHHQIRVTVKNITREGLLKLELFGERNFMQSSGKLRRIRVPAEDGSVKVCINVAEPGEYAVVGYHDRDGDRKLDKKWNFMPKEPYGLSNNPVIKSLRLPKWDETRFTVPENGVDIVINLVDLD